MPRFRRLGPEAARAKAAAGDLVTEADLSMEAVLAEGARAVLPGAAVVAEEAVAAEPGLRAAVGAEFAVIVDPLDGTWNFTHGVAVFGVILAVARWGEPVWGLLYDPLLDDWVVARRAGGAWFGRPGEDLVRLRVAPQAPPEAMTGFVPLFLFPPDRRRAVADAMLAFGRATSLRCACHEHRLLAQGRVHFVVGAGLEPWDHAAGALAVREAGGCAELLDGRAYACQPASGLCSWRTRAWAWRRCGRGSGRRWRETAPRPCRRTMLAGRWQGPSYTRRPG